MKNDKWNLNGTFNGDKSIYDNGSSDELSMDKDKQQNKKMLVITRDSMLNGTHEKGMPKKQFCGRYQCNDSGEYRSVSKK